mgnify:CR=1 FL=1
MRLTERLEKVDTAILMQSDSLPCIDAVIIERFLQEIAENVIKTEEILKVTESRRTSKWYNRYAYLYDGLYYIAKMQEFHYAHITGFHFGTEKELWDSYCKELYWMDTYYRRLHMDFRKSLFNTLGTLDDLFKSAVVTAEHLYQNWYLSELNGSWNSLIKESVADGFSQNGILQQDDFYRRVVQPIARESRVFVIISDALRYEVATELTEKLLRETNGTAKQSAMQSVFPSITKFGMAALLPHKALTITDSMKMFCDEMPTDGTENRDKILKKTNPKNCAVTYETLLTMKQAQRRELVSGADVVYIYHNTIDAIGDKAPTEQKVFEACTDALEELAGLVRVIVNDMQGTDILITADHGFLYTYRPLTEGDKVGREVMTGTIYEIGRRYALTSLEAQAEHLLPVQRTGVLEGFPLNGYTPRDATRIKVSGGGENYVHGGVSLQEMVVPVIAFKNLRSKSKQYVEVKNAGLKLLSESRKITNLLFSLDFLQEQPVGDKIQPCTYTIYMTDGGGVVVSDRQTVIADRTSANASERVFRVRFNLKAGTYDRKQEYRLVIANGTDVPEEVGFQIDVAFADDFGFDL